MPKYKYLVVEPGLSYVSFAQPLTAEEHAQVHADCHTAQYPLVVVPYSPQLYAVLKAQKAQIQKQPASPLQNYMQAVEEDIKEEIQHANNVQHLNALCAAHLNVHSIFSKNKKHNPVAANSSHIVLQFPKK
jgi:hypothetical protein